MPSGLKTNYIRTIPGGGRNFLATLLNKHYNNVFTVHHSKLSNEYFGLDGITFTPAADVTIPFWSGRWEFLKAEVTELNNISHGHAAPHKFYDNVYYVTHQKVYTICV